jgi:hypothetical protein
MALWEERNRENGSRKQCQHSNDTVAQQRGPKSQALDKKDSDYTLLLQKETHLGSRYRSITGQGCQEPAAQRDGGGKRRGVHST